MKIREIIRFILNLLPIFLVIALGLIVIFNPDWLHLYDTSISNWIQSLQTPTLTHAVMLYTKIGNSIPFIVISLIVVGLLFIKSTSQNALFVLTSILLGVGSNHFIKQIIRRQRPELRLIHIGGYSFPSGHSAAAMVLFGSLIILTIRYIQSRSLKVILVILLLTLMLALALTRIYLNVHYPTDVTAGLLLGLVVLQISFHLFFPKRRS